ncbi:hypothetical protein O181_098219 [Austropuccinia psidii MF-1]|uniref:Integrase catalytic domain-containing protein n=1 Tax=Austropuccinia psidii MF-1 TaxID=1389203 RepID=A0A9Q3JAS8_9BASI|nr:hypothetical protein [Austropuccinia psidii MF-1]
MNWVTALPPGGDKSYNSCLVIEDRYSKIPIFLPCHKDDTAIDTALLIWSRVTSHTGLPKNIISDTYPNFKLALWTNLHKILGSKLSFSMAYHPQTDGLAERMIQTPEDMIRRFFAHSRSLKILMALPMIGVLLYQHWNQPTRILSIIQQERLLQCWKKDGTLNFQLIL